LLEALRSGSDFGFAKGQLSRSPLEITRQNAPNRSKPLNLF